MKEFEFIRTLLSPLSQSSGAAALTDDVALLESVAGPSFITTDTLVEGVHFFRDDPLDTVGQKLVRVNVSDCLAKGGVPRSALFNLTWPKSRSDDDLRALIYGLGKDLSEFGIDLIGGDTTTSPDVLVLSLTLIGEGIGDGIVRRHGASPGDEIWVTGKIGSACVGLHIVQSGFSDEFPNAVESFRIPPLAGFAAAQLVSQFATASADISDGLVADLGHIAEASSLGATIDLARVPLAHVPAKLNLTPVDLITGGDDYQIVFTAKPAQNHVILAFARDNSVEVSCIGQMHSEPDIEVIGTNGMPIEILKRGWEHEGSF